MQIVCITTQAAAQVLVILLTAHLQPARDFELHPVLSLTPPITYTLYRAVPGPQMAKLRAIADTTIIE